MPTPAVRPTDSQSFQLKEAAASALNPNAILLKFLPTGASAATARQEGLSAGIGASHRMALVDLPRLQRHMRRAHRTIIGRAPFSVGAIGVEGKIAMASTIRALQMDRRRIVAQIGDRQAQRRRGHKP